MMDVGQHCAAFVLGAGTMGVGIATLIVAHGMGAVLVDVDPHALEKAARKIPQQLRLGQLMGHLPKAGAPGALRFTTSLEALGEATLVVESIVELPPAKAALLRQVSERIAPGTPIVSNTSAIPIDELAMHVVRPEDVVGAHFMNPPFLIRMVEVIRGPRTAPAALERVVAWLAALGKESVVVGDGPGFVINRVLQRMINEAARVVQEGQASIESVDMLFKGCLGHGTGPLATADLIGLDNVVDSLRVLYDRTRDPGYQPCELLLAKVRGGDFGRKTGRGFYDYDALERSS